MKSKDVDEKDVKRSAEEMDEIRQRTLAYEYLCHLEEAKKWMEATLREQLPSTTELEENLRNGVFLAKLGHFMAPEILPLNKIYDIDQKRYAVAGLQFRHTDNINFFLKCLKSMQLPYTFQPETTDIYDKKNMPRLIYCIHALSTHLFKLGRATQIQDLYGKVNFTDEEIDTVSRELQKLGVKMPAFQKIGGILTNCMEGDIAALHAAVITINQSLIHQNKKTIFSLLQNPAAQLQNVNPDYVDFYFNILIIAKEKKAEAALNRSLNDSYVPDAYDELLTQAEIQGHINNINIQCALDVLDDCIRQDKKNISSVLKRPDLQLQHVIEKNDDLYTKHLKTLIDGIDWQHRLLEESSRWQKKVQEIIISANDVADELNQRKEIVRHLNHVLESGSEKDFYRVLTNPKLKISNMVDEFAIPLYYEEMNIDHSESQMDLLYDDIVVSIRVLTAIANVTKAVDTNNPDLVYRSLNCSDVHINGLEENNKVKYLRGLLTIRNEKKIKKEKCQLLTYSDIQDCIDFVNEQCAEDNKAVDILQRLNKAVQFNNKVEMLQALEEINVKSDKSTSLMDSSLYMKLFRQCLIDKHSDGSELWLEDVEDIVKTVLLEKSHIERMCSILHYVNASIEKNDVSLMIKALKLEDVQLPEKHSIAYFEFLRNLRAEKQKKFSSPFVKYTTSLGNTAFLDIEKSLYTWDTPKDTGETYFITKEDLEVILKDVTKNNCDSKIFREKELTNTIILLQAYIRGYLVRKRCAEYVGKIIKIQAWWRGVLQRQIFSKWLTNGQVPRSGKNNEKTLNFMDYYAAHESKIIKIQALWRGRLTRQAFHSLLRLDKPPFSIVRHFASILNFTAQDYDKDLQLQQLKNEVVKLIKHNQNLAQQLDDMDIKIGLVIQNRIALQDLVAHGKNLENLTKDKHVLLKENKNVSSDAHCSLKGLKSLTKEGRRMLEGYQHLFYALQTNPAYLSKLLFLLPHSKLNKFLHDMILKLFNYGSNSREEYLLLKLLGTALQEEIRCKFQKPMDVVSGNPLVLKMAVAYARQLHGQRSLRDILGPIINKILADKTIMIETNPVDIYKSWRNQLEMETGETSDLPYNVTSEKALQYDAVRKRLDNGMRLLQKTVLDLLNRIITSRDLIPYGMLYMAKVLNHTLTETFPGTPEKDILKVVGDFIYYHYINAAIVAPDAYEIVTLTVDRSLSNDQRRNLASIAKILQFAASKKGFGEEAKHLVCLNPFIVECHEKFKKFFRHCCRIQELDERFSMHEYTEVTLIHKPEIAISLQDICDTHCLLLDYEDQIAPDRDDPIHELLEDLGNAPSVASLIGLNETDANETNVARIAKKEVYLVLTNKFEVPDSDDTNYSRLFIKTKELLVSIMEFLRGETLVEALETETLECLENAYAKKNMNFAFKTLDCNNLSLSDCKRQLNTYLNKLQLSGLVAREDGYQTIVTAVARDLCNKSHYRVLRSKELKMLRSTKQRLVEKEHYYREQVKYYSEYIRRCLQNLNAGKGTMRALKNREKNGHMKLKSKNTLKYSAAKLQEKGILLEIAGLPQSQFKNVIFEITPTGNDGVFTVRGKFMGVEMEKIEVDVTNLLTLQYEGSSIMNMFGKAKINVNLLLYLLNCKYYGKK
ncbi:ras GTPase-activating-like protein IQGAP1 [Copidosoma floridanum]|uniref:ras GTPase-activating-like protein IQGAP1 n=1 Tax=Copidosoma floridanum TaxID=29053 RepID=UPI000C6FA704|nr:ras GTPase-activating-like protein IQGAP1 [Copidosoma floridanum]